VPTVTGTTQVYDVFIRSDLKSLLETGSSVCEL
jgi:hypothetical protein